MQYYGIDGNAHVINSESGPFFTGMKHVMNMPSFALALNGPTSTSKQKAVATRFAGDEGMLIVLDNQRWMSVNERFWDCSWLSAFNEEDERLWFGSLGHKVEVASVIIIESALNYKRSMDAFWKFDAILSGQRPMEVSARDVVILDSAIASALGEPFAANPNIDADVLDNFFAFTRHKTHIVLYLRELDREEMHNIKELTDFVMHNIKMQYVANIPDDDTNVLKPRIFELFPNLQQITIDGTSIEGTDGTSFGFNLLSLLSVLCDAVIPASFETLVIKDAERYWLKSAFSKEIRREFAYKKLRIELRSKKRLCVVSGF